MKRTLIALVVASLAAVAGPPAGAVVTTDGSLQRYLYVEWYEPTTDGYKNGFINIVQRVRGDSVDAAVTPTVEFLADGWITHAVTTPVCCTYTTTSIPQQAISPTALSMDPLGNSARFTATLSSPAPHAFDLTLIEPQTLSVSQPCTTNCSNVWYNPQTNGARASSSQAVFLQRFGYRVSGIVDNAALTTDAYAYAASQQYGAVTGIVGTP